MFRLRTTLAQIFAYLCLAMLLTWPLVRVATTHAPGDGSDDPAILWNLWWVRHSIVELAQSPFQAEAMFWPIGVNLVFYTLTVLNGLLSVPLQYSLGLVPANSAIIFFEIVVAALGGATLTRWLLGVHNDLWGLPPNHQRAVAFVGGAFFAFASSRWVYLSLGQFNIAASHWVPWSMLALSHLWQVAIPGAPRWRVVRVVAMAALFLLFAGWTEFTYAAFLLTLAPMLWAWHSLLALMARDWTRLARYTGLNALVVALFLIGMSPILTMMVRELARSGDFLVEGLGFSNVFSNDLLGFWLPSHLHPLVGQAIASATSFAYLNFAYLGWVPLVLALVALRGRGRGAGLFWAASILLFGALSLGPTLRVNGREWELPLPFDLMLQLPFFKANRYPSRYSVMIALCLMVLASYGLALLLGRLRQRLPATPGLWPRPVLALLGGTLALFLAEIISIPLPLSDFRTPPFYRTVREAPGQAILELPLAWRNGFRVTGTQHPQFMFNQFYQSAHGKALLSGNTSRNPELLFQYFTEAPFLNSLLALETGHALPSERAATDAAVAPQVLAFLDAPTILVHRSDAGATISPSATIPHLEASLPLRPLASGDPALVAWAATLPSFEAGLVITPTGPLGRLPFAEGWAALPPLDRPDLRLDHAWVQAEEARLILPRLESREAELRWVATTPAPQQRLTVTTADGWEATIPLEAGTLRIPTQPGRHNPLRLRFSALAAPPPPTATIGTMGIPAPAHIVVESAGQEVGDFAHIWVNGVDLAPNRLGYNVVVLDAATGHLLNQASFDTAFDPQASQALAEFVAGVPAGAIVAVAGNDTVNLPNWAGGGDLLGPEAIAALESIGATGDLRGTLRWSHAILGVKGVPAGSALEDLAAIRPARVWVGLPLTAPSVAAGFSQIELRPITDSAP